MSSLNLKKPGIYKRRDSDLYFYFPEARNIEFDPIGLVYKNILLFSTHLYKKVDLSSEMISSIVNDEYIEDIDLLHISPNIVAKLKLLGEL